MNTVNGVGTLVKDTWNQAGENFTNRWNAGVTLPQQFVQRPMDFVSISGPVAILKVGFQTEVKVLSTELKVLSTEVKAASSSAAKTEANVVKTQTNNTKTFNAQNNTQSTTQSEAFRKAKDQNGVPRSKQPDKTYIVRDKNSGKPLKTYDFTNSKGKKITIRKDNPVTYPDGGKQGPHFNAGSSGGKLKQHHYYEEF